MSSTQATTAEKPKKSLIDSYNELFECIIADSEELIDECYKLRYQVYCLEQGFQEPHPENGEYERDKYDGQAVHALLRHRLTGKFIGTVRVIITDKEAPQRLPLFDVCEEHMVKLPAQLTAKPCAEISRFCISKNFRRRVTDTMYSSTYSPREMAEMRSRTIPFMALGLMAKAIKICSDHHIDQACALIEPSLIRMLDKLGIHFTPIGHPLQFHGVRQAAHIEAQPMLKAVKTERPDVYELLEKLL